MLLIIIEKISAFAIPLLVVGIPLFAHLKGVRVFESFVQGAQDGLIIAVKIIPYLVAMLVAINLLRISGVLNILLHILKPVVKFIGVPPEVVPLVITRPLSGSGAFGLMVDLIQTYGPDSFIGRVASTMQGSTDTTFYILTVYFGSVGIRKYRHALVVGLIGDIIGLLTAVYVCRLVFT